MKICWDNLDGLHVYKDLKGEIVFKKGGMKYVESDMVCAYCGEPFLKIKYYRKDQEFCSYECVAYQRAIDNSKGLIGQRFGKWVVTMMTEERPFGSMGFLCRCDCGTERVVDSTSLIRGSSRSCGCSLTERNYLRAIDVEGYKTDGFRVIDKYKNEDTGIVWRCLCKCGNYFYATASHIKAGTIKSCGCSRNKYGTTRPISELGITPYEAYKDKFGSAEEISYEIHKEYGIKILKVKCTYCGKLFMPSNDEAKRRIYCLNKNGSEGRFYCSNHCKQACPIFKQILFPKGFRKATSREVQAQLRQLVLKRDDYKCQICGKDQNEVELHCHHIEGVKQNPIESADVDNCITLCKEHHKFVHSQKGCTTYDLKCTEK